jgi:HEAT repeat protein
MLAEGSHLLVLPSLALLAGLALLVLAKRIVRGIAERRSLRRRARWGAALGGGPVSELRMRELRALARQAARRSTPQEDMLAVLARGEMPPRDARREPFERALSRAGLADALRTACESRRPVARGRAALLWARLGLPGAERTIAALTADPDPDVRAAATQALAFCASEEAAWALLRALRDGHVEPERVVERLAGAWAARPLLTALRQENFEHVRPWLAEALGLTRDARAERPLVELLTRGDEEQRIRACRALGRLGRSGSASVLVTALGDASPAVRAQAARGLAELREEGSVGALTGLLSDSSWWVRARAADALRALGEPGLEALRRCALSHPDPFARERATEALSLENAITVEPTREAAVA